MKRKIVMSCIVFIGCFFVLCICEAGMKGKKQKNNNSLIEVIYEQFISEGLTCSVQEALINFNDEERVSFGRLVFDNIDTEDIGDIIEMKEDCLMSENLKIKAENSIETMALSATTSHVVEFIEEVSGSGGYYPSSIFRDSSTYGWMCNNGSPEGYPDYIAQFYVPNSYANRSRLKIRGVNSFASCYINNPTAARVYTDNSIRACYGYWSVYFCVLGSSPTTYESLIWIQ